MHHNIIVKPSRPVRFSITVFCLLLLLTTSCTTVNQWFSTPTPSATPTPEPTFTSTPTNTPVPTATATPDPYEIDLEKLSHTPPSYEYLVAHLDEFVQGPDPLTVGMNEFYRWVEEELVPALGDPESRDVNLIAAESSSGVDQYIHSDPNDPQFASGQMEFFYFDSGGTIYPVFLPQIWSNDFNGLFPPVGVIIVPLEDWGYDNVYQAIENGDMYFWHLTIIGGPNEYIPDEANQMIELGLTPGTRLPSYTMMIGFGTIWFGDHPYVR